VSEATTLRQRGISFILAAILIGVSGCQEETVASKPTNSVSAFGPTLVLRASAPGLSSEMIAELIAAPIEKQLAALESLPLVESLSTEGQVEFLLHTKAGCNIKQVESLVADRIAAIKDSLPQVVNDSGFEIKARTAPLFVVAVYSPDKKQDHAALSNYVKANIQDQLTHVPGIGQVMVFGTSAAGNEVIIKQHAGIAIMLAPTIDAKPADIATELKQRLAELRADMPPGMILSLPINLAEATDPREIHLLLELELAPGFDTSRSSLELSNTSTRLRSLPGMKNWISMTRHPLEAGNPNPCLLLHAAADQPEQAAQKIRAAIKENLASSAGISVQLKSFGKPDSTLFRAAIRGPDAQAADELATKFAEKLQESRSYTASKSRSPLAMKPRVTVKLDRNKMAAYGITSAEIATALESTLGQPPYEDTTSEQIHLADSPDAATTALLGQCRVKNSQGNEIALADLATIESSVAKLVVYRINNQPAVLLTAQAAADQDPKDAREQIDTLFAAARNNVAKGDEYKLVWIEE
jgi:multidrug efflux pump subunit AcrB